MASRDEDEHGYYGTSGPQNDPHVYPNGVLINNHAHPFREGNGRTQRELLRLVARDHGYSIDWSGTSPQAMKGACIEAESDPTCRALGRLILLASARDEAQQISLDQEP